MIYEKDSISWGAGGRTALLKSFLQYIYSSVEFCSPQGIEDLCKQ